MSWLPPRIPAEHHAPGCGCDRHDRTPEVHPATCHCCGDPFGTGGAYDREEAASDR